MAATGRVPRHRRGRLPQGGQAGLDHVRPVQDAVPEGARPEPEIDQLREGQPGQAGEERFGGRVGPHERQRLADHPRRVWLMAAQHLVQHRADRLEGLRAQLVDGKAGGKPAAARRTFRSGRGRPRASPSRKTRSVPGRDRPVSINDRCRAVVPAAMARSSWDIRRMARHWRRWRPNGLTRGGIPSASS